MPLGIPSNLRLVQGRKVKASHLRAASLGSAVSNAETVEAEAGVEGV
jgi:hypothetical protein